MKTEEGGRRTIRRSLVTLVLLTLIPMAAFAMGVAALLIEEQRSTLRRGVEERVLAIQTAVDSELQGSITTLHAVSVSPAFERGDLAGLREFMQRVIEAQPAWATMNIALPSGQQIMNVLVPRGDALPMIPSDDTSLARLLETRAAAVGNIVFGPSTQMWDFAVRVPILKDGEVMRVLSAVVKPEALTALLLAQKLPPDWVVLLLDGEGKIAARNVRIADYVGKRSFPELEGALTREGSGWVSGTIHEGIEVETYYRRSPLTGWTLAAAIPVRAWSASWLRPAVLLVFGLLSATIASLALALKMGREISRPISAFAEATEPMRRGEPLRLPETGITELRALADALHVSSEAVRQRQQLLEQEKQALEQADRSKNEFIAMLAHELRNPVHAAGVAARLLSQPHATQDDRKWAGGVVERQTNHMSRLIEDLLDTSRVMTGKASVHPRAIDLGSVAAEVAESWRAAGRLQGRRLELDAAPVLALADPARVEQMLSNLIDNAVKFSPDGTRVRVGVRTEGDYAVIEVSDNGMGFAGGAEKAFFDPFVQGEGHQGKGGLGLGLALVKRFAELQGGSISARSDGQGRGATFTLRLPALGASPQLERRSA